MSFGKLMTSMMIQKWNKLVGRMMMISEDITHYHFVHPTKGKRKISKQRLAVAV